MTHGFRSSLKDWCHETTNFPYEVVEQALGHRIKSTVERSYRRGDLFDAAGPDGGLGSLLQRRRSAEVIALRA